jgi:nitrogen regulatory protein PII
MKKIEAYIKPHRLSEVAMALHGIPGLSGMTVCDVRGWGRGKVQDERNHHDAQVSEFEPHTAVAVFSPDDLVEQSVEAIKRAAHTGLRGDGRIYVMPVEDAVRISSGERGEEAA